jgi:Lhr-like helicase
MARYIAEHLAKKEEEIRQSKSFQDGIKRTKDKQRAIEQYEKQLEKQSRKRKNEDAETSDNEYLQISAVDERNQTGILPECTLITRGPSHTEEKFLDRVDNKSNTELLDFIQRGVAFHHGGMNKSQRIAVEALFRTGYLKVIFSTSTLASGIHMPCKTVAFANDSVWLDTFYYRQASGRAGRRGFDVEGKLQLSLSKYYSTRRSVYRNPTS